MTIGGTIAAIGLLFASGCCAAAAWPRQFFVTGFEPQELLNSSARLDQYRVRVLTAVAQDRIDYNRRGIARAARLFMIAVWIAGISLITAIIVFLVLSLAAPVRGTSETDYQPVSSVVHGLVPAVEKVPAVAMARVLDSSAVRLH
jgi:hypothetical protein